MKQSTRRTFLGVTATGATAGFAAAASSNGKLALAGGTPVRTTRWPSWPKITSVDEEAWMAALRSERWNLGRGKNIDKFQEAYCRLTGAKHCLATSNGTGSILTALATLGIGPGAEVIVPA